MNVSWLQQERALGFLGAPLFFLFLSPFLPKKKIILLLLQDLKVDYTSVFGPS